MITLIDLAKIRTNGGTQSRAAINDETVAEYAEAMADPATVFPPVTLYYDGKDHWLADGFHRVAAAVKAGRSEIAAQTHQGDRRRAILHSVAANSLHGLRRTNDDKRRAVTVLLEDDEWSQWSDSEIARRCAVSRPLVASLRESLTCRTASEEPRTYTTKHGTQAQMNTANIGGPKPDQQPAPSAKHEPETPVAMASVIPTVKEPKEKAPDPYGYSRLTEEALLDTANGLRADLEDEKSRRKKAEALAKSLKEQISQLTADDKNAVIRALDKKAEIAGTAKTKAIEDLAAALRKNYAQEKEIEKQRAEIKGLRKSLENQEIAL